ncbi:MAG: aspartate aminotransferase family protein [Woeseia sp.]|nr:aspartate aminotransferase family protein [Woeseia sp.]
MTDPAFTPDQKGLQKALDALLGSTQNSTGSELDDSLPESGIGEYKTLELLAPMILDGARKLGAEGAFAHMDPPTPWITWATTLWNASLNQNLLHPDVAPIARDIETRTVGWLAPCFGMTGGHMTPGSTVANLTALWAARELKGLKRVVASKAAHLSIGKAAHILGLDYTTVETNNIGQIDQKYLPHDLSDSALVLTAGTTATGAIDELELGLNAAWRHIDAAWAGPLKLSEKHRAKLNGLEMADSVSISAHKWLFQPKESGLVLFRDVSPAHDAISFGADYLTVPNIGILGSHGATAVPLLATLLSWGRVGLEYRINTAMQLADDLETYLKLQKEIAVYGPNESGVLLWRIKEFSDMRPILGKLPTGSASYTHVDQTDWIRHVAANPNANIDLLKGAIQKILIEFS